MEKARNKCISLSVKKQPYLLSIDEASPDILNSVSIYPLRHGKTHLGSTDPDESTKKPSGNNNNNNNVLLFGSNVQLKHCYLTRLDSKCYMCPLDGYCQLNDRVLTKSEAKNDEDDIDLGVELKHGDLILLGDKNLFVYNNPCDLEEESYFMEQRPYSKHRLTLSYLMKHLISQEKHASLKTIAEENKSEDVEALKMQLAAGEAQISELDFKVKELNSQLEGCRQEIEGLKKRTKTEREETSTLIVANSCEVDADGAFEAIQARELRQEHDSISEDFDQQDEIHSAIEKFEVSCVLSLIWTEIQDQNLEQKRVNLRKNGINK